jgi:hypothetical protein
MKTKLLLFSFIFCSLLGFSQDSIEYKTETRLVAFTPLNKIIKINGIGIGVGMDEVFKENTPKKTINGINIDVNPIGFLLVCFYDTSRISNTKDVLQQNGLNLSLAGFLRNNSHNGLNLSMYNYGNQMNGISITAIGNIVEEMNGIYIGGLANYAEKGNGITIGAFNEVKEFKGLQIGISNKSDKMNGGQLGLINKNKNGRNFQIGFWNKNSKRTLPIINF